MIIVYKIFKPNPNPFSFPFEDACGDLSKSEAGGTKRGVSCSIIGETRVLGQSLGGILD
jgi:hypothetical protein